MKGYITKGIGGFYYVKTPEGIVECKPRGIFRKQKITPVAGDEVTLETENGAAVIAEIAPRKNVFVRPPMANLDVLFLVASTTQPTPSTLVLDKLAAIAVDKGVQPVIVCTKGDLAEAEFLRKAYERSTLPFIRIDYETGGGLDEVKQWISGRLCAFCGNSGVGKSTLFNVLAGDMISIVKDTPGVTRDRIYADCTWLDHSFTLIDTGGIEPDTKDIILSQMREQAEIAIATADVILFIVDVRQGMTDSDSKVADMLRKSRKPVVLAVNKVDNPAKFGNDVYEFYNLGLGEPYGISALHGYGVGELLDAAYEYFPPADEEEEDADRIRVALIGKPNVGKSSLLNRVLGEERVIVSNIAGTTRDSVDADVDNAHGKFTFIDTAGIRKKSKVDEKIEKFSVMRSLLAVERADVCVIMIDATEGVTEQDTKVAGEAHNAGKACIIVVNKWDLVEKDGSTMKEYTLRVREGLAYMPYAPVLFISAQTGQRVDKLFSLIHEVYEQNHMRIPTGRLNAILAEATARVQPPTDKGRRLRIFYMTQASTCPPTFVCFCNDARLFHFSYQRYLENQIREVFGLTGTPVRMVIRERSDKSQ